ncbi:MAG: adenosylmethionine decarboxylase [Negativicutes bacterium]
MKPIGTHFLIDMYGCSFEKLNNLADAKQVIIDAVKSAGMTFLEFSSFKFEPQGFTAVALLAESHLSIHTYPESGYAAIDVFTCGDASKPERAVEVLTKFFTPQGVDTHVASRGYIQPV